MYDRDKEHLDILGIIYYVNAGVTAALSLFVLFYVLIGVVISSQIGRFHQPGNDLPEDLTANLGTIIIVAGIGVTLFILALALLNFLTARGLRTRRNRTICFITAILSLTSFPYGTLLGIFTIIVLTRQSVVDRFAGREPPAESLPQEEETALAGNDL